MQSIPVLCFPTPVIVVDDNRSFLEAIENYLEHLNPHTLCFENPKLALTFLNEGLQPEAFIDRHVESIYSENLEAYQRALSVDIEGIYTEIFHSERFQLPSTVILDYDIPGMNGLEIAEKIKSPFIQKILLTGAADEHLAVEAFNKGRIHKFIQKHDKNMFSILDNVLMECKEAFFANLSNIFMASFSGVHNPKSPLVSAHLSKLFYTIANKHNIIEYYLFSPSGSFIMFDADGNHYDLFVFSQEDLDEMIMYAEDVKASENLLNDLQAYRKAVCFFNPADQTLTNDSTQWGPYIQPIQPIEGMEGYYYVCKPNLIPLTRESYISFNQYLDALAKEA